MSTKLSGNTSSAMRRRGMTMFEFAMFLSVLFAVFLSVFEFCRVAVIRHTVDNAVYEACLVGMRPGVEARDCEQEARAVLQSIGTVRARVSVEPRTFDESTDEVTVRIEVPLEMNSLMPNPFVADQAVVRELTLRRSGSASAQ